MRPPNQRLKRTTTSEENADDAQPELLHVQLISSCKAPLRAVAPPDIFAPTTSTWARRGKGKIFPTMWLKGVSQYRTITWPPGMYRRRGMLQENLGWLMRKEAQGLAVAMR